mgnify:CR=1 FL=1
MDCIDGNNLPSSSAAPLSTTQTNKSSHKTALLKTIAKLYLLRPATVCCKFVFDCLVGLLTLKIENYELKQTVALVRGLHFVFTVPLAMSYVITGNFLQMFLGNVWFYSISLPFILLDFKFIGELIGELILLTLKETKFFEKEKELFVKELQNNSQNKS